ncbi:MAG: prolyl oligopeptidase family serine peptidase [Flavobacteriales bacterium]
MLTLCTSSTRTPSDKAAEKKTAVVKNQPPSPLPKKDTSFTLSFRSVFDVKVVLKYPTRSNGKNILLLHGFNLPANQWCEKTTFCQQALDSGYTLILPDFNKTTYQYKFYTETISKYKIYPTRGWMLDTLFPHLQKNFRVLLPDTTSFIAGISTGGRGAVLVGSDRPAIFRALASLSGDFDQTKMQGEPIYTGYYGPYNKFKNRWINEDNPMRMIATWTVPCFLAHGIKDKVSPASQTTMFHKELKKAKPLVQQQTFFPAANGHDYIFWSLCTNPMLSFFYHVSH